MVPSLGEMGIELIRKPIIWRLFLAGLIAVGLLVGSHSVAARGKHGKITVKGALKTELNSLLKSTNNLHLACVSRNEKKVDENIRILLGAIKRANKKSSLAKDQRPHLVRMLDKARQHLELTLNRSGESRKESLKEAFINLVQIAKVYKLDSYQVYFCPSDKAVWLQKGWKPRNPIHPKKYGSCGKLVR
ncbi:MAG: DUF3347 domain-containing protein [Bdellovibrionales bacterium]|nr:DUF3347 domain-containing protein [Bdellovibrionales bacterium]